MAPRQLQSALVACTLAVLGRGCGPGTGAAVGNAALNTAIGAGVSAARRADGDCYTPCDHGTVCNRETGYCEVLPCGEPCGEGERCDATLLVPRCVPDFDIESGDSSGRHDGAAPDAERSP